SILQGILLFTCLLFIPAYTGIRLAAERSDINVDLLFISTLRPRAIVRGKFVAALVLAVLIFSACTPFMTFSYLLRGLDVPSVVPVCRAWESWVCSIPGRWPSSIRRRRTVPWACGCGCWGCGS